VRINQVAIFVGKDYLVTVRDQGDNKIVDPIFEQIRMKSTTLMNNGTDYLCYLLIDSIVDAYLPIFDSIDDKIEGIESDIIEGTSDGAIKRITLLKKELLTLKKAIFPTMEMVVCIQRGGLPHMNKKTLVYFSDVYDHVVEVIDLLETSRELTSNAIEIYMSKLQNNINEVAKTFGMFAIILMWPTVIGAVYGMNFTGIPEFGWGVYGYLFSLALMAALMLVTWAYFRKKGWV
jgi:magnesium transporter